MNKLLNMYTRFSNKITVPEKYIISYKNKLKEDWDMFVLLLAFQNSFIIPIDLSLSPKFSENIGYIVFDSFVDLLFLADMVIMCLTSYLDVTGVEVFHSNSIIYKYVRSWRFLMDFLALMGNGLIAQYAPGFKLLGFFKLSRILRLGGLISRLNVPEEIKAILNLLKLTLYLFIYLHILGCTWWGIISIN